jgi:hypothetical protein
MNSVQSMRKKDYQQTYLYIRSNSNNRNKQESTERAREEKRNEGSEERRGEE